VSAVGGGVERIGRRACGGVGQQVEVAARERQSHKRGLRVLFQIDPLVGNGEDGSEGRFLPLAQYAQQFD
jgi:hypothetical protein